MDNIQDFAEIEVPFLLRLTGLMEFYCTDNRQKVLSTIEEVPSGNKKDRADTVVNAMVMTIRHGTMTRDLEEIAAKFKAPKPTMFHLQSLRASINSLYVEIAKLAPRDSLAEIIGRAEETVKKHYGVA